MIFLSAGLDCGADSTWAIVAGALVARITGGTGFCPWKSHQTMPPTAAAITMKMGTRRTPPAY